MFLFFLLPNQQIEIKRRTTLKCSYSTNKIMNILIGVFTAKSEIIFFGFEGWNSILKMYPVFICLLRTVENINKLLPYNVFLKFTLLSEKLVFVTDIVVYQSKVSVVQCDFFASTFLWINENMRNMKKVVHIEKVLSNTNTHTHLGAVDIVLPHKYISYNVRK